MPQNRFSFHRRFTALLTLGLTMLAASPGHARSPVKNFPSFAAQKESLGTVALIGDAVVIEDVIGSTEKVYMADCKEIGAEVLKLFANEMSAKGYKVQPGELLSIGVQSNAKAMYHVLPSWEQHKLDTKDLPIQSPPFYVDSTRVHGDEALAAWRAVAIGTWAFEIKKDKPVPVFSDITSLKDVLGADHAFVVLVAGTKIPFGKLFGEAMLSGMTHSGAPVGGGVSVGAGVDFTQFSGTTIRVAMIDCRNGAVLWADGDEKQKSVTTDQVDDLAKNVLKRLP
jgi:hypothetical protein